MPPVLKPERLTKGELKKQLTKHGVELPDPSALKSVYIKLYKDKVQKKVRFSGFSSEEEEEELPDIRISRSTKQMASPNELSPEKCEVVTEKLIAVDGEDLAGFRRSPRKIKKPLRYIEESDGSQQGSDAEKQTEEEPQTPIEANEVKVKAEKIEFTAASKMVVGGVIVSELSDEQLRDELEAKGVGVGPVVESTRKLYERKLEMLLKVAGTGDAKSANESREYSDQEEDEEEEEIDVEESTPIQARSRQPILRSSNGDGSATRRRAMHLREDSRQDPPGDQVDKTRMPPSGEKITPVKSERRWIPVWVAILAVVVIAAFLYLVVTTMESNPRKKLPHQ